MDLYTIRKNLNMGIPLSNIKLRVTDYARVSTDHEEQKKSLRNQVEHFDEFIKKNPNWTYIPGYVDNGITGTSDIKRDNFMKMIDDARHNKFDLIVTKEISRFSRNTLDSIKYTRELLSFGVAVLFVNDNINTALPDSELRLTIMASMAQDEIRRLSERVKFGMNRAIERGEILGNNMLYGYKKDKTTGKLILIEKEALIVKKIYELYVIKELSLSNITKLLNNDNIRTRNGNKWSISTISRMIKNPKYKGYYCAKKSEIVDYMTKKIKYFKEDDWICYEDKLKIPPLINEQLWNIANKRLNSRKKSNKNVYKNRYLYSAKIYCENDNSLFYRRIFRRNKEITWVCKEYLKNGKKCCNNSNIRESELNLIFKDLIDKLEISYNNILDILINNYKHIELNKELKNKIIEKINSNNTLNKIINLLLNYIYVSNKDNNINLNIYLSYEGNKKYILNNIYEFKRGYDTTNTKRYKVKYLVNCYFS